MGLEVVDEAGSVVGATDSDGVGGSGSERVALEVMVSAGVVSRRRCVRVKQEEQMKGLRNGSTLLNAVVLRRSAMLASVGVDRA